MFSAPRIPVLLACVTALTCSSQTPPAFRSNVELAAIPCTVVDEHGAPVAGLTPQDFRVYDNGSRRIIENLWLDTDAPLTIGIILDASESQQDQLAEHRRTAMDLLERILRPGDRTFVISVDDGVRLAADLTVITATLRQPIAGTSGERFGEPCPKRQCGSSPLWNAVYDAARLKLRPLSGSKALLILTDGFDSGSMHTWRQAADEVHRADSSLYAIQYRSGLGGRFAPDLYRLVDEAGGATFDAPKGAYQAIVSRIETDLRRRYVLAFRPERLSGKARHDVRVDTIRPELTVRARKTYFQAPP